MRKLQPKEISRNVPNVQLVNLPPDWKPDLKERKSIFAHMYEWIRDNKYCTESQIPDLHNLVYVGDRANKRLLDAERKRLSQYYNGDELERAVSMSDLNSGPLSKIMDLEIAGDVILIVPDESKEVMSTYCFEEMKRQRAKEVSDIRARAAGTTFALWLKCQRGRPDAIGDLIDDVALDDSFPHDFKSYFQYEDYMSGKWHACKEAMECLKDAWKEYLDHYPDRIDAGVPCHCVGCNKLVSASDLIVAVDLNTDEFIAVHESCFEDNDYVDDYGIVLKGPFDVDRFEDAVSAQKAYSFEVDRIREELILGGIIRYSKSGWIYFVLSSETKEIKIGYTERNVDKRIAEMQTGHPHKLELLASLSGNMEFEKSLHRKFGAMRIRGEWFMPDPALIQYIDVIKKGGR